VSQGADLLEASEDVKVLSDMIGLMSREDLERGLAMARMAGELWAVQDVVALLEMPVLAGFLEERGYKLRNLAVRQILSAAAGRGLGQVMAVTGQKIEAIGTDEAAEGLVRLAASEALAEKSADMQKTSEALGKEGADEMARGLAV
jgi:hypothetical protein